MEATEIGGLFEEAAPIEGGTQRDRDRRVLGFRFGDPDIEAARLGVAWRVSMEVILEAIARGLNLLLVHEPHLFYGE